MGCLFVSEGIVKPYIMAIDSTLIKAVGNVWHKSSMDKGIIPYSGIDTDARWGFSHTKGLDIWIQTTFDIQYLGSIVIPLVSRFHNRQCT